MLSRVATFASHSILTNQALQNAAQVTNLSNQASSGYKSQNYAGIAKDTQQLLNLEGSLSRTNQYLNNTTQVNLRLQNMESAVDNMQDVATKMKTLLIQSLNNDQADDVNLPAEAKQSLAQVESLLNTSLDGRYLFSGGATNQAAADFSQIKTADTQYTSFDGAQPNTQLAQLGVTTDGTLNVNGTAIPYTTSTTLTELSQAINTSSTPPPAIASVRQDPGNNDYRLVIEDFSGGTLSLTEGGAGDFLSTVDLTHAPNPGTDQAYYQGDQQQMTSRIDTNYDLNYGVRADNSAFESLVRSLKIMSQTTDPKSLNIALGHLNNAINDLPNVNARIGIDSKNVETVKNQHEDFQVFANNAISDIENVDIPLTLAQLEQQKTALQASYMTISQSSDISLVNYMR